MTPRYVLLLSYCVQASHEGDFDPTHAVMSRRLMRDPIVHGEEDARAALRHLQEEQGPKCRARYLRGTRMGHVSK